MDQIIDSAPHATVRDEKIVNVNAKKRNFSFSKRNPDTLDTVDFPNVSYQVPATPGSTYWAILKVMYSHVNEIVPVTQLLSEVDELMRDRDEDSWDNYCGKVHTTVYHRVALKTTKQKVNSWQERIIGNAKTLTRVGGKSPYGARITEKGHSLKYSYDKMGKAYFILQT